MIDNPIPGKRCKVWRYGYAVLPCFKVRVLEGTHDAEFLSNDFMAVLFSLFFRWFWSGKIRVTSTKFEYF